MDIQLCFLNSYHIFVTLFTLLVRRVDLLFEYDYWKSYEDGGLVMKQFISPYQFMLLIANFIFAASLITLPQVLTQISDQIAWITPLIVLPIIVAVVLVGFGKGNKAQISQSPKEVTFTHHAYYFLIGIFLITIYIRDLRALVDFTSRALLQTTPIEVIAILITIVLIYISSAGLEVIARITAIQFVVLGTVVITLPLMLFNEIEPSNIMPIIGTDTVRDLSKSAFQLLPWIGESLICFFLL